MQHGAGSSIEWNWFYPWVLSPYLLLGALIATVGAKSRSTRLASLIAAIAVSLGASYLYVDAMYFHVSSTSALIFVFVPPYCLLGGLAIFAVTALLARKMTATNDT